MLIKSTDTGLQVITSSAGKVEWYVDYADVDGAGNVTVSRVNSATAGIATSTTTTILGPPASGSVRKILTLRVGNSHATVAQNPLTLQINDGTNVTQWDAINVAASEAIAYADGGHLVVLDSLGREKLQSALLTPGAGVTGISAVSADTYVGGMAVAGRIQQGSAVHWSVAISKTAAGGTTAPVLTFRSGTTNSVSDTSRVALTSPYAQTSVIDSGTIEAFAIVRTYGASGILVCGYQLSHALAATGFATQAAVAQSAVSSAFDLTAAGLYLGLSINPGASGSWSMDSNVFAANLSA